MISTTDLRLMADKVLVTKDDETTKTWRGLILPESSLRRDGVHRGVVRATGDGYFETETWARVPCGARAGDVVLFGKYSGEAQPLLGDDAWLLRDFELIARLTETDGTVTAIEPLGDRVLLEPEEQDVEFRNGLWVPPTETPKCTVGRVVAVGRGRVEDGRVMPMETKVGDRVAVSRFIGTEVALAGVHRLLVRDTDVLCTIESAEDADVEAAA